MFHLAHIIEVTRRQRAEQQKCLRWRTVLRNSEGELLNTATHTVTYEDHIVLDGYVDLLR